MLLELLVRSPLLLTEDAAESGVGVVEDGPLAAAVMMGVAEVVSMGSR